LLSSLPRRCSYAEGDILKMELKNYGEFEAILMDPPWHTGDKNDPARLPGTVTPEELVTLATSSNLFSPMDKRVACLLALCSLHDRPS
jgi:hypothetical protein